MDGNNAQCLESIAGTYGYIDEFVHRFSDNIKYNSFNLCCLCATRKGSLDVEYAIRQYAHEPLGAEHNIYYGYKEAKRLGLNYTYPDPEIYNNAEDYK